MSKVDPLERHDLSESIAISQRVIPYIRSLGYSYIDSEVHIPVGSRTTTADAVVYLDEEKSKPYIVVEIKHQLPTDLTLLDPAVQQAFASAVALGEQVRYLLITDGVKNYWFERSAEGRSLVQLSLPPEITERFYQPTIFELPLTPVTDPEQFVQIIESVINVFVQDGLTVGLGTAVELNRILIAKLHDEQTAEHGDLYRFAWRGEPGEAVAEKIKQLYEDAIEQISGIYGEHVVWSLSARAFLTVVQILEPFALTSVSASIRGRFFWRVFARFLIGREAQYASPSALAEFVVQLVNPVSGEFVIDPACGTGLFLVEAFQNIASRLSTPGRTVEDLVQERLADRQRITGVEINAQAAELAATNLALNNLPPQRVVKANALDVWSLKRAGIEPGTFDVVLLDPPIGSAPKDGLVLDDFELYRGGGRITLEVLFIEQALRLLRPGGRAAIIVPDSVLSSPSYLYVRQWLLRKAQLRAIISLPPEAFAPLGHSGKASIILLKNEPQHLGLDSPVLVADIQAVGYDRFGRPTRENDLPRLLQAVRSFEEARPVEVTEKGLRVWRVFPSQLSERLDVSWLDPHGQEVTTAITRGLYPVVPLHEIVNIISGRNFKQYVEAGEGTAILIQAGAVRDLEIDLSTSPHLSFEDYQQAKRAQIQRGDVLVTTTGAYLGRAAVVDSVREKAVASGAVTILRPRSSTEIDPFFLAAVINSEIGREQIDRLQAAATAQPYIRRSDLGEMTIPLPPLAKQEYLARRVKEMLEEARALARRAEAIEADARKLFMSELLEASDAQ